MLRSAQVGPGPVNTVGARTACQTRGILAETWRKGRCEPRGYLRDGVGGWCSGQGLGAERP